MRGYYVHYKGGIYFSYGGASNYDEGGDRIVVYESCTRSSDEGVESLLSYRKASEFHERVDPRTGLRSLTGVPRFQRVVGWNENGRPLVIEPVTGSKIVFIPTYIGG